MPELKSVNSREDMLKFWQEHAKKTTPVEMMLDEEAERIGREEVPEILGLLPDLKGKRVLELGAGIGRFTGEMAKKAQSVTAVEFMEAFHKENQKLNGKHNNVVFKCADATKVEFPPNSFDVIFMNWLLMYLDDTEVNNLFKKFLSWLPENGYLFFRESCFHRSGNKDRSFNPTFYRTPADYKALIDFTQIHSPESNSISGFEIVFSRSIQTYIKLKNNANQICWLFQKTSTVCESAEQSHSNFQQFLDKQQYSTNGILRYEKIFGKHFVSTGGLETTTEFVEMLRLQQGEMVLDVGCGIGGSAFYMAKQFGATVVGMDLSSNMINIALERAAECNDTRVQFEVADATKREYPPESFHVVYSRDTILHIQDKLSLFKDFLKWLKPGGRLLISDYCCTPNEWSENYTAYVKQRGYRLVSVKEYGKLLEKAGFVAVNAMDRTGQFKEVLERELEKAKGMKHEFIQEFSEEDYLAIVNGWQDKLQRVAQGDQKWGLFYAEKAAH
jgi:phosphoethanolamine N-methyltransferase